MTASLDARSINMTFRNGDELTRVLVDVNVTLAPGELVALLGASGSGKSTLLSIVGLLLRPTAGIITIGGERADTLSDAESSRFRNTRLGFIFQFHNLLPDFTALENVGFPAAAAGDGMNAAIRRRAEMLLSRVGLSERINFPAARLSGGQKQRVAIARALMNHPQLVLADEPTGSLDRASADQVLALMREINREDGTTFLVCTHDERVASHCTRRITLRDGRIDSALDTQITPAT